MTASGYSSVLKRADISTRAAQTTDLAGRYPAIAARIARETHFTSQAEIGKSTWWGQKIGAVMYRGTFPFEDKIVPAVLKIEAVNMRPDEITEAAMIHYAQKALAGSGIRPPKVYHELPWTTAHGGYSAIIMEDVPTDSPIRPLPGTEEQIEALLLIRERYKKAFQNNHVVPWVARNFPTGVDYLPQFIKEKFASWQQTRAKDFPNHPFHKPEDDVLIDRAIATLIKGYHNIEPEFQQGHFSHRDVVQVGKDIVMFSNLYWSWRPPLYDAVFASHWYMYELANVPRITIEQIEKQRHMWQRQYKKFTDKFLPEEKRLFALARMERFAAGLNLDALSISQDPQNKIAEYLVKQTREDLHLALQKLTTSI